VRRGIQRRDVRTVGVGDDDDVAGAQVVGRNGLRGMQVWGQGKGVGHDENLLRHLNAGGGGDHDTAMGLRGDRVRKSGV